MRRLLGCLKLCHSIRLLPLRRIIRHRLVPLRPSPSSLARIKRTSNNLAINLTTPLFHNRLLSFHHRARLALVVNAEYFAAELKVLAGGRYGKGFVERDGALAVYDAAGVEFGDVGDGGVGEAGVEVCHFGVGELLAEEDGVGWEDAEVGVQLLWYDA